MRRPLLLAGLLLAAAPAPASVTIGAEVSRDRVALGEQIALTVTVSGDQASLPSPSLPAMDGFSVYDAGRSTSLSFVNGRVASNVAYTYALTPRAAGTFKIPPITAAGAEAPTAPIEVVVTRTPSAASTPAAIPRAPASAGPAPGATAPPAAPSRRSPDVFITAALDKKRAYVNQQVTLTVRFLNAVQLAGNVNYDAPQTTGFLTEDLPPVRTGATQIDGRSYEFREIKVALFPLAPGRLKIGPATIHCAVARMDAPSMQDFFDRFLTMGSVQPVTVATDPLFLDVEPLPSGKPEDFTGVTGRLTARATADRTSVKAGEAVTLSVVVSGAGNLKSIPEPPKPDLPSLRFFQTESGAALDTKSDRVGGSKTFRMVAVPRVSGKVRVPSFSFSYFEPDSGTYGRAATAPIDLDVAPGAPGAAVTAGAPPSAPGVTAIGADIRYLKTSPRRAPVSAALSAFADLGPWHAAPFAAFLACALAAWRRRAAGLDPRGRRFREALPRAQARLAEAAALPAAQSARAAALVDDALAAFVADKLDAPAAGLTLKTALEGLKALKTPPSAAALDRLRAAWEEADLRRFAPGAAGDDARKFAEEASALLKALDAEVRR